jgi:hypothetical protein
MIGIEKNLKGVPYELINLHEIAQTIIDMQC